MYFRCENTQSAGARAVEHRLAQASLSLAPGDADWGIFFTRVHQIKNSEYLIFRSRFVPFRPLSILYLYLLSLNSHLQTPIISV